MKAFSVKKRILVLVAMLLLVLALAACGGGNGNGNGGDTPPPAGGSDNGGDVVAPQDEPAGHGGNIHEPRDLAGRTITTVANWHGVPIAYSAWEDEEPDPATAGNYYVDRRVWENAQRVYADFNFSFDPISIDYGYIVPTLTSSVMAGDPFADIFVLSGGGALPVIQGELIQPLSNINLPNSDLFGNNFYSRRVINFAGDYWSFLNLAPSVSGFGMGINLDIINATGAPNPVDLYNQGRWTWDALLEIMRLATADTTGDGTIDRWGISGQPGDLAWHFIGGNDGRMVTDDFQYWFDHPNTIEALEFIETIFREGLFMYDPAQGFDTGDWGRNFFAWQSGQSATWKATTWAMNDGDLPFEFAFVPFPTGPSNTSGNTWMAGWEQALAFPSGVEGIADVLMVLEEFWSWPGDDTDLLYEGALAWPRGIFLTEEDVLRVAGVTFSQANCIGMQVPQYNWITGSFVNHFHEQTMTVLQAVEAYRGPQQEILDNFLGN